MLKQLQKKFIPLNTIIEYEVYKFEDTERINHSQNNNNLFMKAKANNN